MLELIGYDRQYDEVASYLLGDVLVVENLERALALWRETQTDEDDRDPRRRGDRSARRRHRRLARVGGGRRARAEARDPRAGGGDGAPRRRPRGGAGAADRAQAGSGRRRRSRWRRRRRRSARTRWRCSAMQKDLDRLTRRAAQAGGAPGAAGVAGADLRPVDRARTSARLAEAGAALENDWATVSAAEETRAASCARGRGAGRRGRRRRSPQLTTLKIGGDPGRRSGGRTRATRWSGWAPSAPGTRRARPDSTHDAGRGRGARRDAARGRRSSCATRRALWQAEAEARARAHGERQGAVEDRQAALAEREAELRAARTERRRDCRRRSRGSSCAARRSRCGGPSLRGAGRRALPRRRAGRRGARLPPAAAVRRRSRRARMTELRGLIERMGEINLTAIEESEELQKRFDFLTTQKRRPRSPRSASWRRRSRRSTAPRASASARRSTPSTPSSRRCSRACSAAGTAHLQLTDDERPAGDRRRDHRQPARARRSARTSSCSRAARRR